MDPEHKVCVVLAYQSGKEVVNDSFCVYGVFGGENQILDPKALEHAKQIVSSATTQDIESSWKPLPRRHDFTAQKNSAERTTV